MKDKKKESTLEYKCRRCGIIYGRDKGIANEGENIFTIMMIEHQGSAEHLPSKNSGFDVHSCADGSLGVADFVGIKQEKKLQEFPQVYTVNFMDVVDPSGDENMKAFNEFCVKCHADKNTKNLHTGHLAVLWHFATGKGVYEPAGSASNNAA